MKALRSYEISNLSLVLTSRFLPDDDSLDDPFDVITEIVISPDSKKVHSVYQSCHNATDPMKFCHDVPLSTCLEELSHLISVVKKMYLE